MNKIKVHIFNNEVDAIKAVDDINNHYDFPKQDGQTLLYTSYWIEGNSYLIKADDMTEVVLGVGIGYDLPINTI